MRRGLALAGAVLLLLPLASCAGTPQSRETGSTALAGVLGVEPVGDGLQIFAAAEGRGEAPPTVAQGQGATPAACIEELTSQGERVISCAHVEHLLLARSAAASLPELLSYAFQEPQQSTETQLWVVDTARLAPVFTGKEDPARRMGVLKTAGKDRQTFRPVTLRQAAGALAEGEPLLIPALTEGPAGLDFIGYALYSKGQFTAWLTGESALGAALLLGERIHWTGSSGEQSLSLQSVGCQVTPVMEAGQLTGVSLRCRLEGVPTGGWEGMNQAAADLEVQTTRTIELALRTMQEAGADGAALLRRAGLARPLQWHKLLNQWEAAFPDLDPKISVTITVAERQ